MKVFSKSVTRNLIFLFFTTLFLFTSSSLFAEAIRLTSGQILEGKILEESEKTLIIQTNKGIFTIKKSDIMEMERAGSKDVIVKPPAETKISFTKMALMSFIPGYSPIYNSKERPEFGIPFAMVSLNYFFRFLQFQTSSKRVGFLQSTEMKEPLGALTTFIIGPNYISNEIGLSTTSTVNYDQNYQQSFLLYYGTKKIIYNMSRDRVVGGVTMTEDEYLKIKKKYLANYIATSLIQVAVSYFILHNENNLGALYKTEHNGINTAFYAFPTNDGGIFATVSRF